MIIDPKQRTEDDPSIVYNEYTEVRLPTTEYILFTTPGKVYTIKNRSGFPVYVAFNDDPDTLDGSVRQYALGGTISELNTHVDKYTWIRAGAADVVISIRPADIRDPSGDITNLTELVNALSLGFALHKRDQDNIDHAVTAAQVNLGNLPNAISNDPASNNEQILATTKLTSLIRELATTHINSTGNVHNLSKANIDLGNVANYAPADVNKPDDLLSIVTDKYVTPAVAYRIVQLATVVARSARPQLVLEAAMGTRLSGWFEGECDIPSQQLAVVDRSVVVRAGLRVSFGSEYKTAISEKLSVDIYIPLIQSDNTYFVYVDINSSNQISSANMTVKEPVYGTYTDRSSGADFFNYATCQMYNGNGEPIRRVYIGKIIVSSGIVTNIINVPIGNRYVFPLQAPLVQSARHLVDNPFMMDCVHTRAEVSYQNNFGPTGWNDQIGVIANLHPASTSSIIVVQCGQMGFLSAGRESGNAFGSAFTTILNNLRTRVVVERTLF